MRDVLTSVQPDQDGADVRLTPDALPSARSIAAAFDSYLRPAEMRFSHAV